MDDVGDHLRLRRFSKIHSPFWSVIGKRCRNSSANPFSLRAAPAIWAAGWRACWLSADTNFARSRAFLPQPGFPWDAILSSPARWVVDTIRTFPANAHLSILSAWRI